MSLLELEHVTHFYGTHCALRDVNLVLPGGAIGLVGQNGAGKSTLMQIVLGLIRPTHGQARVLGQSLQVAGTVLRGRIGFMPERDASVPGLNGIEYAALAGELSGMPRRQALRRAHETLSYLGMEDARYRRLEQFSVGMMQRLKLAATLVHDPDLLLLDEPTAGLDPEGRQAMLAMLRQLAARPGKSLLLSSHLLGDIEKVCTSAVILNQGTVISTGRLEALRTHRPRAYLLKWQGDGSAFIDTLRQRGVSVNPSASPSSSGVTPTAARATVPPDWQCHTFFALALEKAIRIVALEPDEEDLEAVYHRLIQSSDTAAPVPATEVAPT